MRAVALALAMAAAAGAQTVPGDLTISSDAAVGSLNFSADGKSIAATCGDGMVRLWDTKTAELQKAFSFHKEDVAVTLAGRADLLAAAGRDGGIKIWDLKTGETIQKIAGPAAGTRRMAFSADRQLVAGSSPVDAEGSEYTVRIWDASGKEQHALAAGLGGISALAFSPDGRTLVAAGYDTNLRAWSTRDGELLRLMDELPLATFAVAFSPDGNYLATAGADRIVYLWDTKTWKIARKFSGQPEMISALAFSPDSRMLLTGGFSEFSVRNPVKAMLWNVSSGKPLRSMGSAHMVRSAAFSPDGTQAATSVEQTVNIWAVPPASK